MKKLSKQEVRDTVVVGRGRMPILANSKLYKETTKLKVGEAIMCSVQEWPLGQNPSASYLNIAHKSAKTGMHFASKKLPLAKGFVFIRIK